VTAAPELPAADVAHAMLTGGFHHLPVVEDERPLGVVGLRAAAGFMRAHVPGF
jgi:CBS domain-containing protein